jgi:hypothetical protein
VKVSNCLLTLALIAFSTGAVAEEIQLKDGSKVTGAVTSVTGDTFQVKTEYGDIKIPRSKIVAITFSPNPTATTENGKDAVPAVTESLQGTEYSNQTADFRVTVPSGWALAPELRSSKDIVAALKSPDETMFLMVTPEKFVGTLATFEVLAETHYQENFREYEKLSENEAQIDGRNGVRVTFQGKPADKNVLLKFLVYVVPYDGRMVRLSFLTLEPLFTNAVPTFEKIAASYRAGQRASAVKQ